MDELIGEVALEVTARGSKSERESVVLHPVDHGPTVALRTRHPTTLSADPGLSAYAGQRVRVRGEPLWAGFVVDEIEAFWDPEAEPAGP